MKDTHIRRASIDDIDRLADLARQTYSETFGPHNTKENLEAYLTKAFSKQKLAKELAQPNSRWYLALVATKPAGYMKVNFGAAQTELQDEKAMEIERIYVRQEYQGYKIGKRLMEQAISIALQHQAEYIWLGVWEKNVKALQFYERHGFVIFSQHSFFVGDDEQTDCMMKLTL